MTYQESVSRRRFLQDGVTSLTATAIGRVNSVSKVSKALAICWIDFDENHISLLDAIGVGNSIDKFTLFVSVDEASRFATQLRRLQKHGHLLGFRPKSTNHQADYAAWKQTLATNDAFSTSSYVLGLNPTKAFAHFCAHNQLRIATWAQIQSTLNPSGKPQLIQFRAYPDVIEQLRLTQQMSITLDEYAVNTNHSPSPITVAQR